MRLTLYILLSMILLSSYSLTGCRRVPLKREELRLHVEAVSNEVDAGGTLQINCRLENHGTVPMPVFLMDKEELNVEPVNDGIAIVFARYPFWPIPVERQVNIGIAPGQSISWTESISIRDMQGGAFRFYMSKWIADPRDCKWTEPVNNNGVWIDPASGNEVSINTHPEYRETSRDREGIWECDAFEVHSDTLLFRVIARHDSIHSR